MGGTRPRHQTAADARRRGPHAGHGATRGPPGRPGAGAGLRAAVPHRWVQGVYDRPADALWAVGAAIAPASTRASAQAALDAPPAVALRTSGEDRAASPSGSRAAPGRVRHTGGGPAGAGGVRLADQYRV